MPRLAAMVEEYLGAAGDRSGSDPRPKQWVPPEVIDMSPAPKLPPEGETDKAVI